MQERAIGHPGPEQATPVEKLVEFTRLPYPLGCVAIGCLLGPPAFLLLYYADSLNFGRALTQLTSGAFFTIDQFGQPLPFDQGLAVAVLFTLFLIMTLYCARYLRTISSDVESSITSLRPELTEDDYHRMFGGISQLKFILILTAAFCLLYVPPRVAGAAGPFSMLSAVVLIPLDFFIIGSTLWIYLRSLWGVYRFGSGPLKLRPFFEDRMLGLHPVGALSLSFGIVYFLLDTLAFAGGALTADLSNLLVLVGLLILLATMLFIPLYGIHHKMQAAKREAKAELNARVIEIASAMDSGKQKNEGEGLSDLKYLLAYRILNGEAMKIPTWPFETGTLERFLAVFLSVTAIIIARLIQIGLHL